MDFQTNTNIDLCKRGNTEAFRNIVAEYQQLVYTLAFRLLCNEADAEDVTQDTFIKIWQNINQYKNQYKFSTWIYRITCNICYDKLRTKRKVEYVPADDCEITSVENQVEILHNKELKKLILTLTGELSPKQKLIFTLSDIEDLDVDEIKTITGMSAAKIKSNLYLARKYIKLRVKS